MTTFAKPEMMSFMTS